MRQLRLWAVMLLVASGLSVRAQEEAAIPPGGEEVRLLSEGELDVLLGPVALYPDPLLAALLTAATQPAEIIMAARFMERGGSQEQADTLDWSDSLKALTRYPDVLLWMDENLEWTAAVGKAFLIQPEDVMDAIQRLRARAEALGNLVSTELQRVESEDGTIDILPTDPDFVYVPNYEPAVVFSRPAGATIGPLVTFGGGMRTGAWLRHDWDWGNRRIVMWKQEHARPRGWWGQTRTVRFQNATHAGEWCPQARKGQAQGKWWGEKRAALARAQGMQSPGPRAGASTAQGRSGQPSGARGGSAARGGAAVAPAGGSGRH